MCVCVWIQRHMHTLYIINKNTSTNLKVKSIGKELLELKSEALK